MVKKYRNVLVSMEVRGLTLIEIVVVMAVISLLVGLLLAVIPGMQDAERASRTGGIIGVAESAFAQFQQDRQSFVPLAEHPLAGTAESRALFVRGPGSPAAGSAVLQSGEALAVDRLDWVSQDQDRCILPSDRYAGCVAEGDLPLLYGMPRSNLRVLGISWDVVTRYRALPDPTRSPAYSASGKLRTPLDKTTYPDAAFLVQPALPKRAPDDFASTAVLTYEEASRRWLATTLGDAQARLLELRAIKVLPEGIAAPTLADAPQGLDRVYVPNGTTRPYPRDSEVKTGWKSDEARPGMARVGNRDWRRYRFYGFTLCDAWGVELLSQSDITDGVRLMSAGKDGLFRWNPGPDGMFQTRAQARDDQRLNDDSAAWRDNIATRLAAE